MSLSKAQFCLACKRKETEVELKTCSRCKFINYCSKQCQVKDHKNHLLFCKLLGQGEIPTLGNVWLTDQYGDEYLQTEARIGYYIDLACFHDHYKATEKAVEEIGTYQLRLKELPSFNKQVFLLFFLLDLGKKFFL